MLSVLMTRPAHQAEALSQAILSAGGTVFYLPLFEIKPVFFQPVFIDNFDYCIFLSANAVTYFFAHQHQETSSKPLIAIGPATQQMLYKNGFTQVICPADFNSDGLLAMSELQAVTQKKIVIISGENSKPLLRETLHQRGAMVTTVYCYRREPIQYDLPILFGELQEGRVNAVISTSMESYHQLLLLFQKPLHRQWLLQCTLCVIHSAMKAEAQQAGFIRILQAHNATDSAIFKVLQDMIF